MRDLPRRLAITALGLGTLTVELARLRATITAVATIDRERGAALDARLTELASDLADMRALIREHHLTTTP